MSVDALPFWKKTATKKDWIDLRDQPYNPNLAVLRQEFFIDHRIMREVDGTGLRQPLFGVRNQADSGRCVGFALANVVDLQRSAQLLRRSPEPGRPIDPSVPENPDIVSADMLYRMARFHDEYPTEDDNGGSQVEGVYSLRSVIKGFYHHGVCLDWPLASECQEKHRWQSECYFDRGNDAKRNFPTVAQAKKAHDIGLGAYYRLASVLNHFHAALNDAEAILVSAKVHDGWGAPMGRGNEGIIHWSADAARQGSHAFVIVGYDSDGFHVLNSWGESWGGYKGQVGIGLWTYADWAQNIIDAWVLRLGVHAPNAFGESVGEKGTKGLIGKIASGSTPCFELIGHYMHLDDGGHISTGSYPSFPNGWKKTHDYLCGALGGHDRVDLLENTHPYKGILVWIPGSFEGIKVAFNAAVQRKNRIKGVDLYPYTLFWCNGFAEKSIEVLQGLFDSCEEQAGSNAAHLDDLIENEVRGVGRAIWRDMEMAAKRAIKGQGELPFESTLSIQELEDSPGYMAEFFEALFRLVSASGVELHVVTEGAGVLVLHEALAHMATAGPSRTRLGPPPEELFASLNLVLPAVGVPRALDQILPLVARMNAGTGKPRAKVHLPDKPLQNRLCFGAYGKSILHLVSRAFEDRLMTRLDDDHDERAIRKSEPRTFLGMFEGQDAGNLSDESVDFISKISGAKYDHGRVPQNVLSSDPQFFEKILTHINSLRDTTPDS